MQVLIVKPSLPQISHWRRLDELKMWCWRRDPRHYIYLHNEHVLDPVFNQGDDVFIRSIEEQIR
jgi:hypothetical protein